MFNKSAFQQLVYSTLFNINAEYPINTPPPAIMKPTPLWTGKQVVCDFLNRHENICYLFVVCPVYCLSVCLLFVVSNCICWQVSTVLGHVIIGKPPINVQSGTKMSSTLWGTKPDNWMNEGVVFVRDNELLCGIVDKELFAAFGLVHVCSLFFFFFLLVCFFD
jgi:hypothetical protein